MSPKLSFSMASCSTRWCLEETLRKLRLGQVIMNPRSLLLVEEFCSFAGFFCYRQDIVSTSIHLKHCVWNGAGMLLGFLYFFQIMKIILEINRNQPSPCHFCLISSGQVASSARLVAAWQPKLGFWAKRDFFWLRKVHVLKHSLDEIFNALN